MNNFENNAYFWQKTDTLFLSSKLEKRFSKGESHPLYRHLKYPTDFGVLLDTGSMQGKELEVYVGSKPTGSVDTIIIAADILEKSIVAKLLLRCTLEEERAILDFLNKTEFQKTVLIRRGKEVPNWGPVD